MEDPDDSYFYPVVPMDFVYNYRVGPYMERYLDGLKERKIMGTRCEGCKKVFVPPRMFCGPCNRKLKDWVEVAQMGTLENYTIGHVVLEKGKLNPADSPYILGLIKLDDADSLLLAKVEKVTPSEVKAGLRLKAVWRDETAGDYFDLDHFEPA
jgi:hypothetical protein